MLADGGDDMELTKRVAIYSRVSTDSQTVDNQVIVLREVAARHNWQIVKEYSDAGISGAKGRDARPGFDELMNAVVRKEFDQILVFAVDRIGRSTQQLIQFLQEIQEKRVDLYIHGSNIDTSTSTGKALFGMMSVFADLERSMIRERVLAGLARAKQRGVKLGRKRIAKDIEDRILAEHREGLSEWKISKLLRVGVGTVYRVLKVSAEGQVV